MLTLARTLSCFHTFQLKSKCFCSLTPSSKSWSRARPQCSNSKLKWRGLIWCRFRFLKRSQAMLSCGLTPTFTKTPRPLTESLKPMGTRTATSFNWSQTSTSNCGCRSSKTLYRCLESTCSSFRTWTDRHTSSKKDSRRCRSYGVSTKQPQ